MKLFYMNAVFLVLFVSSLTVSAQPIDHIKPNCGQQCPRSLPVFIKPEVGTTYVYNLETNTLINVKETQSVGIKARVEISAHSPCEYTLQLRGVQLTGIPDPTELQQQLESNPLNFGSFDGKVLGVCPAENEEIWALNVKKSILSGLQMTARDLTQETNVHEVDFSGHCATTYKPLDSDDETVTLLEKSKSLNKCHKRRKDISGFNSRSLILLTEILRQKLPIMVSNSVCTQQIKNNIITSVSCTEDQRISFQESSVVSSSLSLKLAEQTRNASPKPQSNTASQLLLISRTEELAKEAEESDVLSLLGTICSESNGDNLSPELTETFHSLVQSLKTLPNAATERIDTAVKSGEICPSPKLRDLFIAASAFASSDASIQTIVRAYNNKEFSLTRATALFSLIALKAKPTEQTIDALIPLIQSKETARPLVLGISLLVQKFCEKNSECEKLPAVKRSVDELLNKLQKSDCNLEKITTIKAIDNIGPKSDESVKKALIDLAANKASDSGVRVAAIQALTRMSDENIRQRLIEVLQQDSDEVDVRISAYKSVVTSGATPEQWETIRSIKDPKIENYVRTHVRNLKKSRNPERRKILPQEVPDFEQPTGNSFGVTRNIEIAYKSATIEADVIHPKGSLVPQLLNLNVWLPVHGHEFQLLEVSFRHVGLDKHLKKVLSRGVSGPEISLRIAEELIEFIEHIKDPNHVHNTILQLTVRMSGKNILFIDTLEDIHAITSMLVQRIKEISQKDQLDRAIGAILLDTVVEVPTLNGFPMVLHLNNTAIGSIKAKINVETVETTDNLKSKTRKVDWNREILSELSAGLNLQVAKYRPGFEYHMRFSLTPTFSAIIESRDRRILKAKINLPKQKQTIAKLVQSTRMIDANGQFIENNEVSDNEQDSNDANAICRTRYGLSICKIRTPVDGSPVPNVEYYISKDDKSMEAIELLLEAPPKDAQEMRVWSARLNATNSEVNREILAEFQLLTPSEGLKQIKLKLKSPRGSVSTQASILADKGGRNSDIEIEINCPKHIELKAKTIVNKTAESRNLDMKIDYKLPHSKLESISWGERVSYSLKRDKKKPISISYFSELNTTQFPKYNTQVAYYLQWRPYKNTKSELTIGWDEGFKDKIRLSYASKMDIQELRPFKMVSENSLIVEVTPLDINYDLKTDTDITFSKNKSISLSIDLVGKDVKGREDLETRGSLRFERIYSPLEQNINATLKYPGREMSYTSQVKQIKDLSFAGVIRYEPQKGKVVTIQHKESITNPTKDFKFELESEVSYSYKPDKLSISSSLGLVGNTFESKNSITHNSKKYLEWILSASKTGQLKTFYARKQRSAQIDIDNIFEPRSAEIAIKNDQKSYKIKAQRVPKEWLTVRVDSTQNSRLQELEIHISRVNRSSIKLLTSEGLDVKGFIDPISKIKRAHLQIDSPKRGYSHVGDIKYLGSEDTLIWESNTNKSGKPYITVDAQFSCRNRTFLIIKKIKSADEVSKLEYFYDKGVYGLVIDSSRFTAFVEGENKEKKFGKMGFFNKQHNYEYTGRFNIENGVLVIESVSNKEKMNFTKLDAVIGLRQISNVSLITPRVNAQLIINPLGEKKTLNFNLISPKYDQKTFVEVIPKNQIKIESLSERKVEPLKRIKVDALLSKTKDSTVSVSAPELDVNVRKTKGMKPQYIFNTTLNGYNEIQEFDVNRNVDPVTDLIVVLYKYLKSYTVSDD